MNEESARPTGSEDTTVHSTRRFDARVYRLEAVKKAAYRLSGQLNSLIRIDNADIVVELWPRTQMTFAECERLAGQFCAEVLDQELRENIAAETDAVRNLIIAHSFSRTSLIDQELDACDYGSDPLQMGIDTESSLHPRKG